jgi:DNA-binding GntR family transcriptional regulator
MTFSSYIRKDLKSYIKTGDDLPFELTLTGIAEHYGVSLTPVRAAVRDLVTEHYLQKASNGRISLNRAFIPVEPVDPTVSKPALPPDWRKIIARDVMLSSLRGDAGFLREEATAGRYGVSRTVIRQVFNHLVGKGFLEHVPRAGWRVRCFDEADMCAYLEVREVLELKALALAQPYLERAHLESMLAGNPIPETGKPIQLDNRIHAYLIEKANNFYLRDFFERHGEYYMLLFEHAALGAKVVAEMAEQHRAILHALIEKDWDSARQALVCHIRSQLPVMHKLLAEMAVESSSIPPLRMQPNGANFSLEKTDKDIFHSAQQHLAKEKV